MESDHVTGLASVDSSVEIQCDHDDGWVIFKGKKEHREQLNSGRIQLCIIQMVLHYNYIGHIIIRR